MLFGSRTWHGILPTFVQGRVTIPYRRPSSSESSLKITMAEDVGENKVIFLGNFTDFVPKIT